MQKLCTRKRVARKWIFYAGRALAALVLPVPRCAYDDDDYDGVQKDEWALRLTAVRHAQSVMI